jgi:hypothetical protein
MRRSRSPGEVRSDVLKLARILERDPDQLAYLEQLSPDDLRQLRERVTEALWSDHNRALGRVAAASRLLPATVSAAISERAFGPFFSARLAGLLEPVRAVEVAGKLPPAFLADVAVQLDPRRASEVIARIPPPQIAAVTRELVAREEYVTMGRFVGHLSDEALSAALGQSDDASLLRVAFVLEDKNRLEHLVAGLPRQRLATVVQAAAAEELWLEALDLLDHLSDGWRSTIVASTLDLDDEALESLTATVIEHDMWREVLVIAQSDPALQAKLAERLPSLPKSQRREVAARARADGSLERLGVLGAALGAY